MPKPSIAFTGCANDHQTVFPWNQIGSWAKDHAFESFPWSLQRQHLPLHRCHWKLRHKLLAPSAIAEHGLAAAQVLNLAFGGLHPDPLEMAIGLFDQILNLGSFEELHSKRNAGAFQGAHQPSTVVDLPVLFKQQSSCPGWSKARQLFGELIGIEILSETRRWVGIAFLDGAKGHHNPAGAQSTGEATVGFDLSHPAGDAAEASAAKGKQRPAESE